MTSGKSQVMRALMASVAMGLMPAAAHAQQQETIAYDQPAQDLGDALRNVATLAGIELYASADDLEGLQAPALKGGLTTREAIDALLRGTGLVARFERGSVTIGRAGGRRVDTSGSQSEPIIVTGSRIKGAPSAVPVMRVTSEDIRNAGQNDLGEVARSLPQNFGGGQNPGIGNTQGAPNENVNVNGASTFNLRGIGPNATLTLINGNRFAFSGVNSVIDVSAIPVAAVERVEVIADGASAIYGADAVAGVVNIILKRNYEGLSTTARIGGSTDGGNFQQQFGALAGTSWSTGGVLAAYDLSTNTSILADARSYTASTNPASTILPDMRRHAFLLSAHQTLGANIELSVDAIYKAGRQRVASAFTIDQPVTASGILSRTEFETFGIAPKIAFDLSEDWTLEVLGFYGTDITDGLARIFAGGAQTGTGIRKYNNRNFSIEAGLQGALFELPAGSVRIAAGTGYRSSEFDAQLDARTFEKLRKNYFAYGELFVPITSPGQGIALAHRTSLTGALRYEDNSDSGDVVTPKLGFIYEPIAELTFGISWGKSFKLPTLLQQYSGYAAVLAPVGGFGQGFPPGSTLAVALGASDMVGPERSENWTFSATARPAANLEFSASYFHIDYSDRVAPPLVSSAGVLNNPIFADLVTFNPSAALLDALFNGANGGLQNATGGPYDPSRVVALLDARSRNIAQQTYSGVDVSARYDLSFGAERRLSLSAGGTWMDSTQRLLPGLPVTELAGTIFFPPHLRARAGATFATKRISVSSFVNYTGGVTDNRRPAQSQLSSFTALDLTARLSLGERTEISLNALNIFNEKPDPIFTAAVFDTPFDTTNYSAVGRFLGLTIRHDW
ncbi:MAG: TonB-dependent receptor [Blastomonas fulva]|uniref:TonB-dependent receptor n=1 Tax=Blastomonas fulva TaxID=1550728 RepID=UPI0024E1F72C|nr:TonB-dependent receptor [Blastomonas fulva]MDK2758201.1 TonB-dependent receptor [Blastomonas fulva]